MWSPALAFSLIGFAGVVTANLSWFQLRGGLLTNGLYVLALQFVVSALALSVIDDLPDPGLADSGPGHRWWRKVSTWADGPPRLRRAIWHFYLWHPVPAGLLACGVSMSLSLVAIGVLDRGAGVAAPFGFAPDTQSVPDSEWALGSFLTLTVLLVTWRRGTGLYGWVAGYAVGVVLTQMTLNYGMYLGTTVATWALLSAGLMALSLLYALVHRLLSRRRRRALQLA